MSGSIVIAVGVAMYVLLSIAEKYVPYREFVCTRRFVELWRRCLTNRGRYMGDMGVHSHACLVLNISNGTRSLFCLYNFLCFAISLSSWLYSRCNCTDVQRIALKVECTPLSEIYDFSGYWCVPYVWLLSFMPQFRAEITYKT
jgi:hypothetical protein